MNKQAIASGAAIVRRETALQAISNPALTADPIRIGDHIDTLTAQGFKGIPRTLSVALARLRASYATQRQLLPLIAQALWEHSHGVVKRETIASLRHRLKRYA